MLIQEIKVKVLFIFLFSITTAFSQIIMSQNNFTAPSGGSSFHPSDLNPILWYNYNDYVVISGTENVTRWASLANEYGSTQADTSQSPHLTDTSVFYRTSGSTVGLFHPQDTTGALLDIGTQDFSIDCWVYTLDDEIKTAVIFREGIPSDEGMIRLHYDGAINFDFWSAPSTGGNLTASGDYRAKWTHIAISVDRNVGAVMYIDGEVEVTENTAEWTGMSATSISSGYGGVLGNQGLGHMKQLRVYLSALSSTDVDNLFAYGKE